MIFYAFFLFLKFIFILISIFSFILFSGLFLNNNYFIIIYLNLNNFSDSFIFFYLLYEYFFKKIKIYIQIIFIIYIDCMMFFFIQLI
jgi:hypothetical protein